MGSLQTIVSLCKICMSHHSMMCIVAKETFKLIFLTYKNLIYWGFIFWDMTLCLWLNDSWCLQGTWTAWPLKVKALHSLQMLGTTHPTHLHIPEPLTQHSSTSQNHSPNTLSHPRTTHPTCHIPEPLTQHSITSQNNSPNTVSHLRRPEFVATMRWNSQITHSCISVTF
jgi:hypothetical protein